MLNLKALSSLLLVAPAIQAHMTIYSESMYGVGADFASTAGDPFAPLGPDWTTQDSWWFRGPDFRALSPAARNSTAVTDLVAGGTVEFEIACNVAWTSFGCCEWQTAYYNATSLDACPGNPGAYHVGDPNDYTLDPTLFSGCALAIADVDDIEDVTWDNLAIFSVNHTCVSQKDTVFEVPEMMPACTGEKCICGWFWLANNGTANFYMTAFDCSVSNVHPAATAISAPEDPVYCPDDELAAGTCVRTAGAKRPLYAYNEPQNVNWDQDNNNRPGYHASWSFPNDGAQNDIFVDATVVSSASSTTTATSATETVVKVATTSIASSVESTTTAAPTSTGPSPAQLAAESSSSAASASAASESAVAAASSLSVALASSAAASSSSSLAAASSSSSLAAAASSSSAAAAAAASSSSAAAVASSSSVKLKAAAASSSSIAAASSSSSSSSAAAAAASTAASSSNSNGLDAVLAQEVEEAAAAIGNIRVLNVLEAKKTTTTKKKTTTKKSKAKATSLKKNGKRFAGSEDMVEGGLFKF